MPIKSNIYKRVFQLVSPLQKHQEEASTVQEHIYMAALHAGGNTSLSGDGEAPPPPTVDPRLGGGCITAPLILGQCSLLFSHNHTQKATFYDSNMLQY